MSNVVNLAEVRSRKQAEAEAERIRKQAEEEKASIESLLADLDEGVFRPGPEDKYFELRLRDATMDCLIGRDFLKQNTIGGKTSTRTFVLTIDYDIPLDSEYFYGLANQISDQFKQPIGYLHSIAVARQTRDWSIMVRYYAA